jgi:predicted nucleic acid-binding protein
VIGVDTSVVLRYLVGSPVEQAERAARLLESDAEVGVSLIVLLETAHVLRTQYGVSRPDVLSAITELVTRSNVTTLGPTKPDVLDALVRARSLPGTPIPDAFVVLTARVAGALPIYSFDAELRRHGSPVATP